jgi:hypothetical protein
MIWVIITVTILIVLILFFSRLSGENERIQVFFRIYINAKNKFPKASERELLEIVIGEHILPRTATRLRDSGMSGASYLNDVFGDDKLTISDIIYHAITLEFPNKYKPFEINIDEIRKINRGQKIDLKQQLKDNIENYKIKYEKI